PIASAALRALDGGDAEKYTELIAPTIPLARHLFTEPTFHYKTGVVFLAWLAGHQDHFVMVGGHQDARSVPHLSKAYHLAADLGLFPDPDLAAARFAEWETR